MKKEALNLQKGVVIKFSLSCKSNSPASLILIILF